MDGGCRSVAVKNFKQEGVPDMRLEQGGAAEELFRLI
jgi:hypothetical protein